MWYFKYHISLKSICVHINRAFCRLSNFCHKEDFVLICRRQNASLPMFNGSDSTSMRQ